MKKLICCLAAVSMIVGLTACGEDTSSSDSTAQVTTAVTKATEAETETTSAASAAEKKETKKPKATEAPAEAETEEETTEEETEADYSGSFSAGDLYAYYGGSSITVNQDASTLPAANSVDSSPSCYYEGDDKIFHYGDMDVYTYPVGDTDYVLEITINSSGASTAKGLTVGMSLDDAKSMYGEGTDGGSTYTWYDGATYMYVTLSGSTITSIGLAVSN